MAPPEVASISPNEGPKATLVTINGTNFGTTLAENEVIFNGKPATITGASATQLTVSVPPAAGSGPIVVKSNGRQAANGQRPGPACAGSHNVGARSANATGQPAGGGLA